MITPENKQAIFHFLKKLGHLIHNVPPSFAKHFLDTKDFSFGTVAHSQASCFMRRMWQLTRIKIDQGQASVNILYNERKGLFSQYKSFRYAMHNEIICMAQTHR